MVDPPSAPDTAPADTSDETDAGERASGETDTGEADTGETAAGAIDDSEVTDPATDTGNGRDLDQQTNESLIHQGPEETNESPALGSHHADAESVHGTDDTAESHDNTAESQLASISFVARPTPAAAAARRTPAVGLERFEPPKPDQLGVLPAVGSMSLEALHASYHRADETPALAEAGEPPASADEESTAPPSSPVDPGSNGPGSRRRRLTGMRIPPRIAVITAVAVIGIAAVLGVVGAIGPWNRKVDPPPTGGPDQLAATVTCPGGTSPLQVLATSDSVFWSCGKSSKPSAVYAHGPLTGDFSSTSVDWNSGTHTVTGQNTAGRTVTFGAQLPGAVRLNSSERNDPSAIPVTWSWTAGSNGDFQGATSMRPVAGTVGKFGVQLPEHTAQDQVRYLSEVLAESAQGRDDLGPAVSRVRSCSATTEVVSTIRGVRDNRQDVLDALAAASYDLIPGGSDLVVELTSAITWSLTADEQYLDWAQDAAGGCPTGEATEADQSSDRAAGHKSTFAEQWNSTIAPTYNVPKVSVGQI